VRRAAAVTLAVASLFVAGCGGDDETAETVPPPPELSLPGAETPTLDDLPDSTLPSATSGSETPGSGSGSAGSDGGSGGSGGGSAPGSGGNAPSQGGGQQAPSGGQHAPEDSPENDTPPPPGSPAERFERFCEENPGAC
jgi:hypothetical protein